jgi:prolyl-tRNA synthetase
MPQKEEPLPMKKIATPETHTIVDLAQFLQIPESKTAKAVFFMASIADGETTTEQLVFTVVRGDMELNETKLANIIKAQSLRPATDLEISSSGAVPGYASPIDIEGALIVVDDLIPHAPNLVAGANEAGFHYQNVNYERDYEADIIADLILAQAGNPCPECSQPMRAERGVEVGNIFKLGTRYCEALGANYLDQDGKPKPIVMGSYGIGLGRLLACIAEEHHDEDGLIWPISVAPYHVHLIGLRGDEGQGEDVYHQLQSAGIEVLFDDRDERPGVKFKDADLMGIPIRLTVGQRSLESGGVEFKLRHAKDRTIIPMQDLITHILATISTLQSDLAQKEFNTHHSE